MAEKVRTRATLTDADIDAARRAAEEEALIEPRAAAARYDRESGRILVELTNGSLFGFVPMGVYNLDGATAEQLAAVEVVPGGEGLHWEELDADVSVPGLIAHRLNLAAWAPKFMGQRTSPAKSAASRANGAKGGRPRRDAA